MKLPLGLSEGTNFVDTLSLDCETLNFCCLKPPSLLYFVMTALYTSSSPQLPHHQAFSPQSFLIRPLPHPYDSPEQTSPPRPGSSADPPAVNSQTTRSGKDLVHPTRELSSPLSNNRSGQELTTLQHSSFCLWTALTKKAFPQIEPTPGSQQCLATGARGGRREWGWGGAISVLPHWQCSHSSLLFLGPKSPLP